MALKIIVSYDDTDNDRDALALGRLLAYSGAELSLAYVRHSFGQSLDQQAAEQMLARGAESVGEGNNPRTFRPNDPHGGVRATDRFQIMDTALHGEMTLDRLNRRVQLVEQFDAQRRRLDSSPAFDAALRGRQMALGVTARHHADPKARPPVAPLRPSPRRRG